MFKRLFLDHPASVGESYPEHFGVAARFGVTMIGAGLAVLVGFVAWQARNPQEPLMSLTLFRDRNFSLAALASWAGESECRGKAILGGTTACLILSA